MKMLVFLLPPTKKRKLFFLVSLFFSFSGKGCIRTRMSSSLFVNELETVKENVLPIKKGRDAAGEIVL